MKASSSSGYLRNLSTIAEEVSRRKNKLPVSDSPTATTIEKKVQTEFLPAKVLKQTEKLKFSESKAYFGIDKRESSNETTVAASQSYVEAIDSSSHKRKVALSFFSSLAAVCFYFWYSRKDYDGFLNAPKYEVLPTLKRYVLRKQIEEAQKSGKDTTYLKAALEYVDVEEAVLRAEEGAFTLDG